MRKTFVIFAGISILSVFTNANAKTEVKKDSAEKGHLVNEIKDLQAAYDNWKQCDAEYRALRKQDQTDASEVREFAEFLAELKRQVIEGCETIRKLGGDATKYCVACVKPKDGKTPPKGGKEKNSPSPTNDLNNIKRKLTREEKKAIQEKRFNQVGASIDRLIRNNHPDGLPINVASNKWDNLGNTNGATVAKGVSGGDSAAGSIVNNSKSTAQSGQQIMGEKQAPATAPITEREYEPGAGPGVKKDGKIPDYKMEDIGDGRDDDVIARQLREAAEAETDTILKKQLWNEYKKYKMNNN